MDFYFAGVQHISAHELFIELNSNMLKSYHNDKKVIYELIELKKNGGWTGKLLVDSGAFTCWTKGIEIDVDEYIKWINEYGEYVDYFIQLDKIPGTPHSVPTLQQAQEATEQSWQNYLYMVEHVKYPEKILPVFHKGEPLSHLQRMLEHKIGDIYTPYICLGGSAKDRQIGKLLPWYHQCLDTIQRSKNPNVKIHVLGQAIFRLLDRMPFTSGDSTTWIVANSVGTVFTPYGTVIVSDLQKNLKEHINNQPESYQKWVKDKCEQYGIDFNELCADYRQRAIFNIKYTMEWQNNYEYKGHTNFKKNRLF